MTTNTAPHIGIVGLGNIGHVHAKHLLEGDATLVGGVDTDPDARTRFSERYGVGSYEEPTHLFGATDAIIVATPNRYHEPYAVGALDAGLDILIEKPLAPTVESAERIGDHLVRFEEA